MNKKDYKEIAKIIKDKWDIYHPLNKIVSELADYFEKEDKTTIDNINYEEGTISGKLKQFNRKQFLKDCGVD